MASEHQPTSLSQTERMGGVWSDDRVVQFVRENIGNPSGRFPNLSLEAYLAGRPQLQHIIDGTEPAICVGKAAPDGPLYSLNGELSSATTLHGSVHEAGTPLVVLNFGSYT